MESCPEAAADEASDDDEDDADVQPAAQPPPCQHHDVHYVLPCPDVELAHSLPSHDVEPAHSLPRHDVKPAHSLPLHDVKLAHSIPRHDVHQPELLPSLDDCPLQPLLTVLHAAGGALLGHHAAVTCLLLLLAHAVAVGVHGPAKTGLTCKLDTPLATPASVGESGQCSLPDGESNLRCGLQSVLLAPVLVASVGDTGPMTLTARPCVSLACSLVLEMTGVLLLCWVTSPTLLLSRLPETAVATAQMLPWLCCTRKMSPCSEGTAKGRGQDDPLAGGQGGHGHQNLLDRGGAQDDDPHAGGTPGGPGGGRYRRYDDTKSSQLPPHTTQLPHETHSCSIPTFIHGQPD